MAAPVYKALPPALAQLDAIQTELLALWFYNQPIEFVLTELNYNVSLPKPPGPAYPYPADKTTFPLREYKIPVLASDHMRRCALWPLPTATNTDVITASLALSALLYTAPDYRIISATIITTKPPATVFDLAYETGVALYVVPAKPAK